MGGMEKTTVYLPDELKRALRRAAHSTGRSEADLIREGIGLVRALIGKGRHHGGPSAWRERRREAIAQLHRELHAEDAA